MTWTFTKLTCTALLVIGSAAPDSHAQSAGISGRVEIQDKKGRAADVDEALVWLEGAGTGAAAPKRVEVLTEDKAFVPRVTIVPAGSTVAFPNHDPFDHNVFSTSGPKVFDLGLFGRNQTRTVTFESAGLARIYCNVHARMAAFVLVQNTPYATRPDRGGRFAFDAVPPGRYTLRVWHERGGERTLPVSLPGTAELVVTLDARNYSFVQHLDKNGKSYDARGRRY
jgi:plastocyanin